MKLEIATTLPCVRCIYMYASYLFCCILTCVCQEGCVKKGGEGRRDRRREKKRERRAKCRVSTLTLRNYAYRLLKNLQILIRVIIRKKSIILCIVLSFLSFAFFRNETLSSRYACTRFEIGIVSSSLSQIFSRIILHILNKPLAYQLKNIGRPMDEIL